VQTEDEVIDAQHDLAVTRDEHAQTPRRARPCRARDRLPHQTISACMTAMPSTCHHALAMPRDDRDDPEDAARGDVAALSYDLDRGAAKVLDAPHQRGYLCSSLNNKGGHCGHRYW
jgi:hypothetical protein